MNNKYKIMFTGAAAMALSACGGSDNKEFSTDECTWEQRSASFSNNEPNSPGFKDYIHLRENGQEVLTLEGVFNPDTVAVEIRKFCKGETDAFDIDLSSLEPYSEVP